MTVLALMDGVSTKSARGRDDSDDLTSSLWYPRCWSVGSATGRHESKTPVDDRDRKDVSTTRVGGRRRDESSTGGGGRAQNGGDVIARIRQMGSTPLC
jgi:hypothetical protein